jgi:hypothetical protein
MVQSAVSAMLVELPGGEQIRLGHTKGPQMRAFFESGGGSAIDRKGHRRGQRTATCSMTALDAIRAMVGSVVAGSATWRPARGLRGGGLARLRGLD